MRIFKTLMKKIISKFAVCITLLFVLGSNFAFGQAAPPPVGPPPPAGASAGCAKKPILDVQSLPSITNSFQQSLDGSVLSTFANRALGFSSGLVPGGLSLGGIILLISMLSSLAKAMVSSKPVGDIVIDHAITGGIVALVITNYGSFVSFAVGFAEHLNSVVGGSSPFAAIVQFAGSFFGALANIANSILDSVGCLGWSTTDVISKLLDGIIAFALLLIALVFVFMALSEIIFSLLLGPVVLGVGIVIGPISISGLASQFTKPFFDKWLGFMAGAAIMQFVAYTVLALMGAFIGSVGVAAANGTAFAAQALGIALIAFSASKIFSQVPGMANALVPSTTGTSGGGGGSMAAGIGAVGGAIAGAAMGGGAAVAAMAGGGGIKAAAAAASGGAASGKSMGAAVSKAFGASPAEVSKAQAGIGAITSPINAAGGAVASGANKAFGSSFGQVSESLGVQTQTPAGGSSTDKATSEASTTRQGKQSEAISKLNTGGRTQGGDGAVGASETRKTSQASAASGVASRPNKGLTS